MFGAIVLVGGVILLKKALEEGGRSWRIGYEGERRVQASLQSLSNEYIAVTSFVVPGTKQGDVDLLLIGRMGVLVVEIKAYAGTILFQNGC